MCGKCGEFLNVLGRLKMRFRLIQLPNFALQTNRVFFVLFLFIIIRNLNKLPLNTFINPANLLLEKTGAQQAPEEYRDLALHLSLMSDVAHIHGPIENWFGFHIHWITIGMPAHNVCGLPQLTNKTFIKEKSIIDFKQRSAYRFILFNLDISITCSPFVN
ncbi:hypothetical protein ACJX0J_026559 [Zea mays]